ncbi:hypothetical protein PpBr36_00934 [Pyricularia pennisetigena]|uniref:hypothetical protein n=1 Tax=Pyricularia pennisetigena TaxID=1578925 RepID=UPI0011520B38|nr:hypothetical protein PpBr36_00934 [Pyricularia pennisetigena]TLS28162.1 hypothetical protein PpBr36_00934 [Pyricularia pennisetigena]
MDDIKRYPTPRALPLASSRRSRTFVALAALGIVSFFFFVHIRPLAVLHTTPDVTIPLKTHPRPQPEAAVGKQQAPLVPLEAHIMSKCPDARDCLRDMVLPVMQRVHDKVNFTLSFIGTPDGDSGVACKHGPAECMGNIIELCAADLYPDPKTYLGFTMCISMKYPEIPKRELIEACALEHAVDFKALNDCAAKDDGAYGIDMLRHSVQRTARAGVKMSCTVRLDQEIYCIRDGGEWVDCPKGPGVQELVAAIEQKYSSSK